jgi:integrase/recombinase XerD
MAKLTRPSTTIVHDLRRAKAGNAYPVKLRITYQREQRYYSTGINLNEEDYQRMNGQRPRSPFAEYKRRTDNLKYRADDLIKDMESFNFRDFEALFIDAKPGITDLEVVFNNHIASLTANDKVGTAALYKNTIQSLIKYKPGSRITDISKEWLEGYEAWMLAPANHPDKKARSTTIISMYVRNLRHILNEAIDNKLFRKEDYPFGKKGYAIPEGNNEKLALAKEDIMKIVKYKLPERVSGENQYQRAYRRGVRAARAYFCFSYLANGMNFKDMALLKNSNISGDQIIYYRSKTTGRRKKPQPIRVQLTATLKRIMGALNAGNDGLPDSYIFKVLKPGLTPKQQMTAIRGFIKKTNKYLGLIADEVGIERFTTYAARHSFATILRNSGAPTEYIQEALGHEDVSTTQNYLAGFPAEERKKWAKVLL